ncbi:hypothetical protein ODJ79_12615 [Actinoplanes sp. KI2]|uniref:hypothetical protein n=1 Tax=Actinoplanes sp. KI2 TaxID=2983315 RepID=UPI0021D5ED1A|nr:hypothetical protein [Actinoplanes sp. KI2]MCU7724562.1 hypothetical protein [Actinoplanes sp. KI2]
MSSTPLKTINTYKYLLAGVPVLLVGIWFLYLGSDQTRFWRSHPSSQAFLEALGGLLIVTAGFSMLWELMGKRAFARELMESWRTSADLEAAGIKRVTDQFYDATLWEDCFKGVEKLDIFVAYANTWRRMHMAKLKEVAKKSSGRIRVYLADPDDDLTMKTLSARFETTPDDLRKKIAETKDEFESLRVPGGASIEVWYWAGDRVFTFYRFDNTAVFVPYKHSEGRSSSLPTIACRNGGLIFQFVYDELVSIRGGSRPA